MDSIVSSPSSHFWKRGIIVGKNVGPISGGEGWLVFLDLWYDQEHWYLIPVVNFGEVRRVQLAKSLHAPPRRCPWDIFRSFKVCSSAKESGVRKATGGYCTYSSIVKLQPRFLSFAVEDLPLGRIAVLVPEFAVKDLSLGRKLILMMMMMISVSWPR